MMTWQALFKSGKNFLVENGIEDADFDAFQLLLTFFAGSETEYTLKMSERASEKNVADYFALLNRRIKKEPLQYIIGSWDFYKSQFFVGEGVLIPRPETEELVDYAVSIIKENGYKTIYDLCSGSGCIGLSIAKECPEIICYLFELFPDALYYTNKNLQHLGLNNVRVFKHNVLNAPDFNIENADLIVSNPPYINSREISQLQAEVQKEPHTALDGGEDGLDFYRAFYKNWTDKLNFGGMFAFECGEFQSKKISEIFDRKFAVLIKYDIYGIDRFVLLKKL